MHHCLFIRPWSLVERVRSQWDSTQHGVEARLQQLDDMIGHSNQWEEQRREVKAFIGHNEGRFHNLLQQSTEPLTKQLADNKVREKFDCCSFSPCPLGVSRLSYLRLFTVNLDRFSVDGKWNFCARFPKWREKISKPNLGPVTQPCKPLQGGNE